MPRKAHQYHYIYKTTCLINNRFYIGMHSTSNLEDGYMGSGKRLRHSINKHGKENHIKEILEFLPDRESLSKREQEIVNQKMLNESLCMNIKPGGEGGGCINKEHMQKFSIAGNIAMSLLVKDSDFAKNRHKKAIKTMKENGTYKNWLAKFSIYHDHWTGKKHSKETIEKLKASKVNHGLGETNSQFGSCWITNGIDNKKVKKYSQIPDSWRLGRSIKSKKP